MHAILTNAFDCGCCETHMQTWKRADGEVVLKCPNVTCKEWDVPYAAPKLELVKLEE